MRRIFIHEEMLVAREGCYIAMISKRQYYNDIRKRQKDEKRKFIGDLQDATFFEAIEQNDFSSRL